MSDQASAAAAAAAAEISCVDCVNSLFHCYGAWHQFDRLYKDGRFDDCIKRREELSLCMKLKVSDDSEKKVRYAKPFSAGCRTADYYSGPSFAAAPAVAAS